MLATLGHDHHDIHHHVDQSRHSLPGHTRCPLSSTASVEAHLDPRLSTDPSLHDVWTPTSPSSLSAARSWSLEIDSTAGVASARISFLGVCGTAPS